MQPLCLIQHDEGLEIVWDDLVGLLPHRLLRAQCNCDLCRVQSQFFPSDGIKLLGYTSAGDAGVRLLFSDGHIQGLYAWKHLRQMAEIQPHRKLAA